MAVVHVGFPDSDERRRRELYEGQVHVAAPTLATRAFADYAWELIKESFAPIAPEVAQDELPVEAFVEIVAALKPRFTHSPEAKRLLADVLRSYGCDLSATYFDLPKLRIVTHSNYLTSGVGYAYKEHRDVWYSCPPCQNNWWMPITDFAPNSALAFFPQWWEKPTRNTSGGFDAFEWNANGRRSASTHVSSDNRNHPTLEAGSDRGEDLRIVAPAASVIVFSAAQLHATVPNRSGRTRFSLDFRTAHLDDLRRHDGARIVDATSTGTTIYDFRRADDLSPVPAEVVALYDTDADTSPDRVLVFDPNLV